MAKTKDAETFTLQAYQQLRAAIITGELEPGQRVTTADVRARFDVSTGVLREAITRLEMHGLLRVEPNRGIYVPSLSIRELQHLTEARLLNEIAAVRASVAHGDMDWEADLVAAHHRMARLTPVDPTTANHRNIAMVDAHLDFHLQLISGGGNSVLIKICSRLLDASEPYRSWAKLAQEKRGEDRDVAAEHKAMMDAALARDADLAADLYRMHIEKTAASLALLGAGRQGVA